MQLIYWKFGLSRFDRTPLHYAVQYGNNESMRLLLEAGSKVNASDGAGVLYFLFYFSPLHLAANIGDVSKCELLLDNKANMNAADDTGLTPLHWATTSQRLECVEFFLNKGANTDLRDLVGIYNLYFNRTPLHIAFYLENRAIIQLLLDARADLTIKDVFFLFFPKSNVRIWVENQMKLVVSKVYNCYNPSF